MEFLSDEIKMLMSGAVDSHIHGSPDITVRAGSDLELARQAQQAGMKAILVKSHVTPTASRAQLVQEAVGDDHFQVLGGLVLNQSAGGLNPHAVETELRLKAREIWMPTMSAVNQALLHNQDCSRAVAIFDADGKPFPELYDVLDLVAKYDVVLGSGHISAVECEKLVPLARQRGVKKILLTHPESRLIRMPLDMQRRLAKQGAFFERCFYQVAVAPPNNLAPSALLEQIRATGVENSIIATDFGQSFNDSPVLGLQKYISMLLDLGLSAQEIEIMVKQNPAYLLGL
ncbi:MAG: hypothetical protein JXQ81_05880 [Desulfuromonadales bacterium]|nr:hypothetical protein [Desulfuromonadales bacterium]MBN2792020.1 hypothetical protein [Desulfuromonadales bacterium]